MNLHWATEGDRNDDVQVVSTGLLWVVRHVHSFAALALLFDQTLATFFRVKDTVKDSSLVPAWTIKMRI